MRIRQVYVTSKGMFWYLEDANKKENRKKDYGSRPGDPVEYEEVKTGFVLVSETGEVFELKEVAVR